MIIVVHFQVRMASSTPPDYKTNRLAFVQWLQNSLDSSYTQACPYLAENPEAIPQIFEDVPYMPSYTVKSLFRALDLHILDNVGVSKALKEKIFNPESLAAYASIFIYVENLDQPKTTAVKSAVAKVGLPQAGASTSSAGVNVGASTSAAPQALGLPSPSPIGVSGNLAALKLSQPVFQPPLVVKKLAAGSLPPTSQPPAIPAANQNPLFAQPINLHFDHTTGAEIFSDVSRKYFVKYRKKLFSTSIEVWFIFR